MTLQYDLYWSFRSPYSYLVTGRLVELERDYDVACNVRVVYPMAVRDADFFERVDPLWRSYLMTDVYRLGEFLGVPFRWPRPDPVQQDMKTRKYYKEQPYIHRLCRLGVAATERGKGLAFLDQVGTLLWNGEVVNWHQGDHLAEATRRAGLSLAELDAAIEADPDRYESVISENQQAQREAGHYGVPLMVFQGEPFFGQDRFDVFKWRLLKNGLQAR